MFKEFVFTVCISMHWQLNLFNYLLLILFVYINIILCCNSVSSPKHLWLRWGRQEIETKFWWGILMENVTWKTEEEMGV
jgi:hypothetical protein